MATIKVPKGLDPDQDRRSVGPYLGPNCLQTLSADDTRKVLKGIIHNAIDTGNGYEFA